MYAIVTVAGEQTRVSPGEAVRVPRLSQEPGSVTTVDTVLLLSDGDSITVGNPLVEGASVELEVVEHGLSDKITHVKKIRRKHHRRRRGHRQAYTDVIVKDILVAAKE
jgi:large subunit ribosomal protein L21